MTLTFHLESRLSSVRLLVTRKAMSVPPGELYVLTVKYYFSSFVSKRNKCGSDCLTPCCFCIPESRKKKNLWLIYSTEIPLRSAAHFELVHRGLWVIKEIMVHTRNLNIGKLYRVCWKHKCSCLRLPP